jgi:hypothetical protein
MSHLARWGARGSRGSHLPAPGERPLIAEDGHDIAIRLIARGSCSLRA